MSRLNKIIQHLPKGIDNLYDLFCDHGKLGLGYGQRSLQTKITFIDNKKHIVDDVEKYNGSNPLFRFICEDARLSKFEKDSTIVMCGTGAYLVMDCLKNYQKLDFYDSYNFYFAVNMHHFEFREFLISNSIKSKCIDIITDGKFCYELIKTTRDKQHIEIFNSDEWDLAKPVQRIHLTSKLKSYQIKKDLLPWEKTLLNQLLQFLS